MNIEDYPSTERLEMLARRAGMERSLYLGEAIGNALVIAWDALAAAGAWLRRPKIVTSAAPARAGAGE